jgi:predicted N-acetyltransferase YhbS
VNTLAFGRPEEANVIDRLREAGMPFLSLVAEDGGAMFGHARRGLALQ